MKPELKIIPVDRGYIIKAYEKGGDLRSPYRTEVASNLQELILLMTNFYIATDNA